MHRVMWGTAVRRALVAPISIIAMVPEMPNQKADHRQKHRQKHAPAQPDGGLPSRCVILARMLHSVATHLMFCVSGSCLHKEGKWSQGDQGERAGHSYSRFTRQDS